MAVLSKGFRTFSKRERLIGSGTYAIGTFTKQPSEKFPFAVDFAADLATGETITGKEVTSTDANGVSSTATVIVSSAISGSTVQVWSKWDR